ncbi:LAMI_0F14202g1_1 [Lachancea mirantina]|uniref:Histone chaperone RTT106 n=1 Tax=Lachancea mirantina TaxID=1230905 RepID=A0A1G4K3P3_9SACH|nr:LAMI_0F14202g1_1 [Lachancea mirantina]
MANGNSFLDELPKSLKTEVSEICEKLPSAIGIFEQVFEYAKGSQVAQKRAKISESESALNPNAAIFTLKDVSVLSPVRKKLDLVISTSPETTKPILLLLKDTNMQLKISELSQNVKFASFLPVPEKPNSMYLYFHYIEDAGAGQADSLLINLNKDAVLKQFQNSGILAGPEQTFEQCIEYMRKQAILVGFRISSPFSSLASETVYFHVECHRGIKEGTLYFLPNHLLFGFKKPILLFNSQDIESITYSSITRVTFNVTITSKVGEKYEFSMIDQNEFTKIDEYVKTKQVTDRSMSDEFKAKPMGKGQKLVEGNSALREAAQQLEGEGSSTELPLESDDEEEDEDFRAESELSDGSEGDPSDAELRDEGYNGNPEYVHMEEYEAEANGDEQLDDELRDYASEDIPLGEGEEEDGSGVEYD